MITQYNSGDGKQDTRQFQPKLAKNTVAAPLAGVFTWRHNEARRGARLSSGALNSLRDGISLAAREGRMPPRCGS